MIENFTEHIEVKEVVIDDFNLNNFTEELFKKAYMKLHVGADSCSIDESVKFFDKLAECSLYDNKDNQIINEARTAFIESFSELLRSMFSDKLSESEINYVIDTDSLLMFTKPGSLKQILSVYIFRMRSEFKKFIYVAIRLMRDIENSS